MTITLVNVILYIILFYCIYSFAKKNKAFSTNDPPGPKIELPIIGSLHLLSSKPHLGFTKLAQKFGGIYKLWVGDHYTIVVSDPHYIREIWLKNNDNFINRPKSPTFTVLSGNFTNLVCASEKIWRHRRDLVAGAFTKTKLKTTQTIVAKQCQRIMKQMMLSAEKKTLFNPKMNFKKYSMNIISSMVFSREIAYDDGEVLFGKDFGNILKQIEYVFGLGKAGNPGDAISLLQPFFYYQMKVMGTELDKLLEFMKEIYDDHILNLDPENPKDLFDHIIIDADGKDLNGILRVGVDLLLGGTDTSSNTIEWFTLMMANYPEVQDKAYQELQYRIGQRGGETIEDQENCGNRILVSDRLETPYVNAIIKEIMRLHPIGPLGIPRMAKEDIMIGEYFIPAGTHMIQNIHGLHHDPSHYDQPESFIPERFVHDNHTSHYLPFSIGARNCLGMQVAEMEIYTICANILINFKIKSVDGKQIDDTELFGLAVHPIDYNILLEKRSI
ncbi:cytochrome P450 family protein [Cavenderia fasciculata]|uniref:Cytochrome P450 family protein n=1 Tax=Cavenderia fasciculata TaxID=261658 RepID=F4Q2K9_CACFS|nr:cytochrome P450 family protein [Cavenderia fasciculata]EGG16688.1 cytochrome P450 family protein [Cavenderia fasciculata]|eukprot:XP_004355162.1 cytochrome P450 family protein [Cavenderia fasciculata]